MSAAVHQDPPPAGAPNTTRWEFSVYGQHDDDEREVRKTLQVVCAASLGVTDGLQVQPYRNERTGRARFAAQITVASVAESLADVQAIVAEAFGDARVDVDAFRFHRG